MGIDSTRGWIYVWVLGYFGGILECKAEVTRNQPDCDILQKYTPDSLKKPHLLRVLLNKYYIQSTVIVLTIEDIS